jgi:hypothetical protein
MKTYFTLVSFIIAFPILLFAQTIAPKIEWYKIYDGPGNGVDLTNDITMDKTNNIYLAGRSAGRDSSQDLLILKYSPTGDSLLDLRYMGAPHSWDEADWIAIDSASNIYVVGQSTFEQNSPYAIFHKYSANGALLWTRDFHDNINMNSEGVQVVLNSKAEPIIGYNQTAAKIGKYSTSGDSLWTVSIYDDTSSYQVNYLTTDKDDNIYAALLQSFWAGGDMPDTRVILLKITESGVPLWRKQFAESRAKKIVFDKEANLVLLLSDTKIIKCDSQGDTLWTREYSEAGDIVITTDLVVDSNNDIVFTGYGLGNDSWDYFTQKLSSAGKDVWARTFNSDEHFDDYAYSVGLDKGNNLYVTGGSHTSGLSGLCYTLKYSSAGELQWQIKFDAPRSNYETGKKIFVDDSNNVYVGGEVADTLNGWNFLALKIKQEMSTGIEKENDNIPTAFSLSQNFPNPFNPSTAIRIGVPKRSHIRIALINILGQNIATLMNEERDVGYYDIHWQATVASGVYFYRMEATDLHNPNDRFVATKKMLIVK